MAQYTGSQSIYNAALGDYQAKGFRLVEPDDHVLRLYYRDELVGVLSQTAASIPLIREVCQDYLDERQERMLAS